MSKEMREQIDKVKNCGEFLNEHIEQSRCVCIKNIKFKNGMNYFKDFTYTCEMNIDRVSVGYVDGRFTTMSKDIFDIHFQVI